MNKRLAGAGLLVLGVIAASLGAFLESVELMALGTAAAPIGYAIRDYFRPKRDSVTPMTISAIFFGTWVGVGHLVGYYVLGTEYERTFYSYSAMDLIAEAQILATIGVIVPLLLYPLFEKLVSGPRAVFPALPKVGFEVSDRVVLIFSLTLLGVGWLSTLGQFIAGGLGTLGSFVNRGAETAIFLLAWQWLGPRGTLPSWARWVVPLAVTFDVIYSLMFSYMRGEVVYPILALLLALTLRKALRKRHLVIAVVAFPILAVVYSGIGELRGVGVYGSERVAELAGRLRADSSLTRSDEQGMDFAVMSFIARGCQFGQLSQVARIVKDEGLYHGETLQYLGYAFIPRMVWPEKPLITPGQWFAEKIGRGQRLDETRFSNSINMTLAGEFYLNFSWAGAVLGVAVMTFLFAILWQTTALYQINNNPVGQTLGMAILFQATVFSSAAGIPSLIFAYLAMLAVSRFLIVLKRRRARRVASNHGTLSRVPASSPGS